MVKLKFILFSLFGLLLFSCSGQKDSSGKSLTSDEEKVLSTLKGLIGNKFEIGSIDIITEQKPVIFSQEMSNATFKAKLNKFNPQEELGYIETNSIPELKERAQKRYNESILRIDTIQQVIQEIYNKSSDRSSTKRYAIILTILIDDDGFNRKAEKGIMICDIPIDDETHFKKSVKTYPIDDELIEKAAAIANALNGTLLDYETTENQNLDSLAQTVSDPVLKFILEPVKETNDK